MRMIMSGCWVAIVLSTVGGCQSWSQVNPGIPTGARVPPPGTGTFQVPSQYYNAPKTGGLTAPTGAQTASTPTTGSQATTAAWQPPTVDQLRSGINNSASAAIQDANNRANQVVQASTTRAAAAIERYTDPIAQAATAPPGGYPAPSLSASRSLSDSGDATQLDWQPPR